MNKSVWDRFHDKVITVPECGCWLWGGYVGPNGYGRFQLNNRSRSALRVSYIAHKGPVPDGMDVCHKCDERTCVNPDHLFVGTRRDNVLDCVRKGRHRTGHMTIEGFASNRKMSPRDTEEAKVLRKSGRPIQDIANRFSVHISTIYKNTKG